MENAMTPVRLRLADLLRERKITQKELAEKTGLSENAISKLINGTAQIRFDTIDILCGALSILPGDLFVREVDKA
jgi:DNA-binding Xre family transcriptional regulator